MNKQVYIQDIGNIEFRYSSKFRHLSIRLSVSGNIWLNIPKGVSDKYALEFVADNKDWLLNSINKVSSKKNKNRLWENDFQQTKFYKLKAYYEDIQIARMKISGNNVILHIPRIFTENKIDEIKGKILAHIYLLEANFFLPKKIDEIAQRTGFSYSKVSFRNNKTNWGSCSFHNNISLNIQLMKLPYELIDYVIIHELCHTIEKNHSYKFWKLVERNCPNYIELRRKLKLYSTQILNY